MRVFGEMDLSSAPALAWHIGLADQTGSEIVVDLENATFMDSAGVQPLVDASLAMGPARFSVTSGPPQIQRLFQLTGIIGLLRIAPRPLTLGRRAA